MTEHLVKTLIVILFLSTIIFAIASRFAYSISESKDFTRRRNLWFALTLTAFLAHSFWIYALVAIPLLSHANRRETNPPSLYFFVLFALPTAIIPIPALGLISHIFDISHPRLLALLLLIPAFVALTRQNDTLSFGRTVPDKVLAAYLLLTLILHLREATVMDTFREAFYLFIDVFLPYLVISRSLRNLSAFRDAIFSLVLAIMLLAPIALFEISMHWALYPSLNKALGLKEGTQLLMRSEYLRAITTAGQPIALGYLMAVGLGFYLFLQRSISSNTIRRFGLGLLIAGLAASISRGPWVGAIMLIFVFIFTGHNPMPRIMGIIIALPLAFLLISLLPGGEKIINLLPFIGATDKATIEGRHDLIVQSMIVIQQNPWIGNVNYLDTPEIQSLPQGQGIIDIVNTYLLIALEKGLVGLGLFMGFFVMVLHGIRRAMHSIPDRDSEEYLLGRALLATLISILLIIFTTSSISFIPFVYWSVAGLGVAYTQMIRAQAAAQQA